MPVIYLDLQIRLPPGRPSGEVVQEFLDLVFHSYRWFEPRRYSSSSPDREMDPIPIEFAPLVAYYEEHNHLMVAARTDRDFISIQPTLTGTHPYVGSISWLTSVTSASKASWRAAHAQQVAELMRLVQSPLALAGLETDLHGKQRRLVHKSIPTETG